MDDGDNDRRLDGTQDERRIALCCASNQNRSVAAHALFVDKGFKHVSSFGTGSSCKLPGPSLDKPNVYPFGTPYRRIHDELHKQNPDL
jgi:RNA polymerase II subunit A C-terminal domain phosphatase SSU72